MITVLLLIAFITVIVIKYSLRIDIVKTNKEYIVLLWYSKWAEEENVYLRDYKVLFKFKNL